MNAVKPRYLKMNKLRWTIPPGAPLGAFIAFVVFIVITAGVLWWVWRQLGKGI